MPTANPVRLSHKEVIERLSATRKGATMAAWAARTGVSRGHLYELLRGTRTPGAKVLDALGLCAVHQTVTFYTVKKGVRR